MPLVTLTTDYGTTDPYLAVLKGALLSQEAGLQVVDLSHGIAPGNLMEAAFILRNAYAAFPPGTIHLVAVEELCSRQRGVALRLDGHFFLLPDNGLAALINPERKIDQIVALDRGWKENNFPAREIMAPAAAHLARGGKLSLLGPPLQDYFSLSMYRHTLNTQEGGIIGQVLFIDNFGNLISNISRRIFKEVGKNRNFEILLPRNAKIQEIHQNCQAKAPGNIVALFNTFDLLEIALSGARGMLYNGANSMLGLDYRDNITVNFYDRPHR